MKIAIDIGSSENLSVARGIGMYVKGLLSGLNHIGGVEVTTIDTSSTDLTKFDVVHYPSFPIHEVTLPKNMPKKSVVTIHDMIYLIYPKAYPLGVKAKINYLIQKRRLKKADAVITVSETSKKDIIRFLGISPQKITVIHHGPQITKKADSTAINETKKKLKLPDKFVLYVGGVNYNKNLLTLAKACILAEVPLVMVGKEVVEDNFDFSKKIHTEMKPWAEFIKKYGSNPNILRLGYLSNEEFSSVWQLATMYCQPSFYEGFGMPILEAFYYNVPVVASRTQALVEVGGDACIYVDPTSASDFALQIKLLAKNQSLRNELTRKGHERLKNFSWEKAAKKTYEVYKSIAS